MMKHDIFYIKISLWHEYLQKNIKHNLIMIPVCLMYEWIVNEKMYYGCAHKICVDFNLNDFP